MSCGRVMRALGRRRARRPASADRQLELVLRHGVTREGLEQADHWWPGERGDG